jgi:MSHA biogenesis protein MshN
MSVLNQMLRDLEKRGAMPDVVAAAGTATVARPGLPAPEPAADTRRRWIWAGVLAVAAAFVAVHSWLSYRVQDAGVLRQPLGARQFAVVANTQTPPPAPNLAAPVPAPVAPNEAPRVQAAASAPVGAPRPEAPRVASPAKATTSTATLRTPASPPAKASRVAAPQPTAPTAHDTPPAAIVVRSTNDVAADVDRAAELIARGRSTEAMDLLVQVLARQPTHAAARSSLAALLAEAGRREQALHVLLAGSELDAARFAPPAAQLQAEMGDLSGALGTLARVPPPRRTAGFEALHAGLAQRAGDHMTAIGAYRRALVQPQPDPVWWVGLGVSLEATGEPGEARNAYARAAAEARLPADVRRYVTERLTVLGASAQRSDEARKAALANVF